MKSDEELIAEAIAAGKLRKIPQGVQAISYEKAPTMHERLAASRRMQARAQRIRAAEARSMREL